MVFRTRAAGVGASAPILLLRKLLMRLPLTARAGCCGTAAVVSAGVHAALVSVDTLAALGLMLCLNAGPPSMSMATFQEP